MHRLVVRALELVYVMVIRIHLVGVIIALLQQVRAKGVVVPRQALRQGLRQALRQVPHLHQHHRALVQMVMLCVTAIVQQGIQFTVHLLAIVKITNLCQQMNNRYAVEAQMGLMHGVPKKVHLQQKPQHVQIKLRVVRLHR